MTVWDEIKKELSTRLTAESYNNWLANTSLLKLDGGRLKVSVPNEATKEWMEQEYAELVMSTARQLQLPVTEITYELKMSAGADETGMFESKSVEWPSGAGEAQLNPRFTFANFVVGSSNQFAHAAAKAVMDMPGKAYNPLFIFGSSGLGKTHLIHAISWGLKERNPSMRVVYSTSERFTNQLVTSIRSDRMSLFHRHYRSADVLLIDDVHELAGKERTQEEFFHTFNELYDHQKQIVVTSDSTPKDTPGLVDRLRSRFEWGLMVDLQPPDLETKMAILDQKAEMEGVHLPENVRIFIATKTRSSVRELEGALVKLVAYSAVTREPVTLNMARQVLRHLTVGSERKLTIESIVRQVAEKMKMQPADIKRKTNQRRIAYARQVAMYLVKELTSASLPEIGRAFGGKHHTTVLHSVQKIEKLRQRDRDLDRLIHSIIESLH